MFAFFALLKFENKPDTVTLAKFIIAQECEQRQLCYFEKLELI